MKTLFQILIIIFVFDPLAVSLVIAFNNAMKVDKGEKQEIGTLNQLRKIWERTNITTWDFEELPEKIPLQSKKNKLLGFAYPCLHKDEHGHISIRLFTDSTVSPKSQRDLSIGD